MRRWLTLWASEGRIYGRFGYGVAPRATSRSAMRVRRLAAARTGGGSVRMLDGDEIPPVLPFLRRLALAARAASPTGDWWRLATLAPAGRDLLARGAHRPGRRRRFRRRGARSGDEFRGPLRSPLARGRSGRGRRAVGFPARRRPGVRRRGPGGVLDEPLEACSSPPARQVTVGGEDETSPLVDVPSALAARALSLRPGPVSHTSCSQCTTPPAVPTPACTGRRRRGGAGRPRSADVPRPGCGGRRGSAKAYPGRPRPRPRWRQPDGGRCTTPPPPRGALRDDRRALVPDFAPRSSAASARRPLPAASESSRALPLTAINLGWRVAPDAPSA